MIHLTLARRAGLSPTDRQPALRGGRSFRPSPLTHVGVVMALGMASLMAHAEDEAAKQDPPLAAEGPTVGLCDTAVSKRLRRVKKVLTEVDEGYLARWHESRPDDQKIPCDRYYQGEDAKRLAKLVELGQAAGVRFVVAPAAGKVKREVALSFWLVDVAEGKTLNESNRSLSAKSTKLKKALPDALDELVAETLEATAAGLAAIAPPAPAPEPAADADAAASEGEGAAAEPTEEGAATVAEAEAVPAGAEDAPAPATEATPGSPSSGLRSTLFIAGGTLLGTALGGAAGVAILTPTGYGLREWETNAAIHPDDRPGLNDQIKTMANWTDALGAVAIGASVVGAGLVVAGFLVGDE